MACIILGVTGSIAAYKAADIASALVKYGHGDQRELGRGWHDTQMKPVTPKPKEYRGSQSISQSLTA